MVSEPERKFYIRRTTTDPVKFTVMATFYTSFSSPKKKVKFYAKCHDSYQTLLKDLELEKENHSTARAKILGYIFTLDEVEAKVRVEKRMKKIMKINILENSNPCTKFSVKIT